MIHRCNRDLNSRLEQDHRGMKQRCSPLQGFGRVESAARVCQALEEVRPWFRPRQRMKQIVSLADKRQLFGERVEALQVRLMAA